MLTTPDGLYAEFASELHTHSYGLHSYTSPQRSSTKELQYHATVYLLDKPPVVVTYNATAGYSAENKGYETLTALLSELSPAFNSAMHRSLSEKLLALVGERQEVSEHSGSEDNELDGLALSADGSFNGHCVLMENEQPKID